ncbi:MAG: flagellar filament capping protein FliD, partial [Clostridiaceae bacterium]|nr:flagellar filament capping protein FliD [Clostridiaceae bacterium]
MANGISNILNSQLRLSGLSSGLDTDTVIKQMMRIEQMKVDKVKQDKQLLEWKRNDYREITSLLRTFKDEYFDILKPSTNFKSSTAFASYSVASSNSTIATATAGVGAISKSHSLTVKQLATATKIESTSKVTGTVSGSLDITDFALEGKQIGITLDGASKTISLENYTDISDLEAKLEAAISKAFGTGKLDIVTTGNKIGLESLLAGSTFSISGASDLGFDTTDNTSNRLSLRSGLNSIEGYFSTSVDFDAASNVEFVINGVDINLNKTFEDASINDVISAVNSSTAGVELRYDSLNDKFSLVSKATGIAEDITFTDTHPENGLLKALGIDGGTKTAGQDSIFDLDGVLNMQRSSNNFTVEGVAYTLKGADPGSTVNIEINQDVDSLVDKIKGFVGKYNELISKLNSEVTEKKRRDYLPLTDEQKESMQE